MGPGLAIIGAVVALSGSAPAACPTGVPTQTITVVNQAQVRALPLVRLEDALVAQSLQVRATWGSPCIRFGSGGWPLYIEPNVHGWAVHYAPGETTSGLFGDNTACSHRPDVSQPCALVSVGQNWTIQVSHEVVEMVADPTDQGREICDPVEQWGYRAMGVWVSDFVTPNWFSNGPMPRDHARALR